MDKSSVDVAVVGAGPYGLSIAANVTATGRTLRIFGRPLQSWTSARLADMKLKSDGFASNLSAPAPGLTLAEFCRHRGIPYHDSRQPVSFDTFLAYGLEFQRRFVPYLEAVDVRHVERSGIGFRLTLDDNREVLARHVVLAVGLSHFRVVPRELANLPAWLVSHSAEHHRVRQFAGRDVAILGAGASAVDLAVALIDVGAVPTIVTRAGSIRFNSEPSVGQPSLLRRLMNPPSPLGPGWRSRLASDLPQVYRQLPARLRLAILRQHLGPQSACYLREKVLGRVDILTNHCVEDATLAGNRVRLRLCHGSGSSRSLDVDHVIAATGYWPDIERLRFLDKSLREAIRHAAGVPVLSRNFETSVEGLYATGLAAAGSFGPLMRFVAGADYAARRLGRHFEQVTGARDAVIADRKISQAI